MTQYNSQQAHRVLCLTYKGLTKLANTMLRATGSSDSVDNHPFARQKKDIQNTKVLGTLVAVISSITPLYFQWCTIIHLSSEE